MQWALRPVAHRARARRCDDAPVDVDQALDGLYAEPLEEFTAARDRLAQQARSAGDTGLAKAVRSARKPTAAAWAVNHLVRRRPDQVEQLLSLATALHDAQERMDGRALRDLGRERTRLVDELVRSCGDALAELGVPQSATVAERARETFVAALVTTTAAEAVTSGRLTRSLSYAGFGDVDLSEATAAAPGARRPALRVVGGKPGEPRGRRDSSLARAPGRLSAAEARSRETAAAAAARAELTRIGEALTTVEARIADLEAGLREARDERERLVAARAALPGQNAPQG